MSPKIRLMILAGTALTTGVVSAQSLDQTREYAAEVMADAQQRTSLLGASAVGGSQFGLTSADGTSTLNFSGWHQTTFTVSFLDDNGGAEDDFETGFQTPDTRLIFDGSVVSPDTTYKIELQINEMGDFFLRQGFLAQDFGNGSSGFVGQFTAPVTRESMVENNVRQTISTTPTDWYFGAGQIQGAAFSFTDEGNSYRVTGSFNDGARTANTPYTAANDGDYGITVRGDMAFEGQVDPYFNTTRMLPGGENAMILGGYFHVQQNAETPTQDDTQLIQFGVDFLMDNGNGWNFYGAFHLRSTDVASLDDTFLDTGIVLQGGYFVQDNTEVFGSFDILIPDDSYAGEPDPFSTLAVGVNHFPFAGTQAVRLTGQVTVFLDDPVDSGGLVGMNTNAGLVDDNGSSVSVQGLAQVDF
ncbi:MAG: hypothetical protein KDA31_06530 [Phycisphaerales bacterium]|nr:hypothetical protein [Phycisphaerales bacterium]MCB9836139.1 hypothetical protein [Phycisphaera sp.]